MGEQSIPGHAGTNENPLVPEVIARALATPREFYFSLKTGEVSEGPQGPGRHRLGPYPTREAARDALRTAQARNLKWDEDTKAYQEQ